LIFSLGLASALLLNRTSAARLQNAASAPQQKPSADKPIAVFGALSFWFFGEHGTPRMDTSEHVFFQNDQLAVRCIEEIDFDYAASDATAAQLTAAA